MADSTRIPVVFFRADSGTEPVRDWLKALPAVERHVIGRDLMRAQWRWPVGMPAGGKAQHVADHRIARGCQEKLVVLHGLIKKTAKTPPGDLELARRRMKEIKR